MLFVVIHETIEIVHKLGIGTVSVLMKEMFNK